MTYKIFAYALSMMSLPSPSHSSILRSDMTQGLGVWWWVGGRWEREERERRGE